MPPDRAPSGAALHQTLHVTFAHHTQPPCTTSTLKTERALANGDLVPKTQPLRGAQWGPIRVGMLEIAREEPWCHVKALCKWWLGLKIPPPHLRFVTENVVPSAGTPV